MFWVVVHPFARVWRRAGSWWGHVAGASLSMAIAVVCFRTRGWIAGTDLGAHVVPAVAGSLALVASAIARRRLQRQLRTSTLLGVPELAQHKYPGLLLTDGVYAHVRHPRYLQMMLAVLGWALLSNYVAAYLAVLATLAVLAVVIPLEERELAERFGAEYEAYRRRVPALVPRSWWS
jgi:protein-S-isoprenylcysteine O-methyltransferase Ste14